MPVPVPAPPEPEEEPEPEPEALAEALPCGGCGAALHYSPGTAGLQCPYCGHEQRIEAPDREVVEHAYKDLKAEKKRRAKFTEQELVCHGCGARVQGEGLSFTCQFCAHPLVVETTNDPQIPPEAVLLFALGRSQARESFQKWVRTRWFAPRRLKKVADSESMKSTYLPHWTYDARTRSDYTGKRGEHYYVTEERTIRRNGKREVQTRKVRKTRWHSAEGRVKRNFDDILVHATTKVPEEYLVELEPWPLKEAVPYAPEYLAGHETVRYDVEPEAGLKQAKKEMAKAIRKDVVKDIGGDEQRVESIDTAYSKVTYKHMLLPVWIGSYMFRGRTWQVLVNGQTGEVHGERPYSGWKIFFFLVCLLAVAVLVGKLVLDYTGDSSSGQGGEQDEIVVESDWEEVG